MQDVYHQQRCFCGGPGACTEPLRGAGLWAGCGLRVQRMPGFGGATIYTYIHMIYIYTYLHIHILVMYHILYHVIIFLHYMLYNIVYHIFLIHIIYWI